MTREVSYRIDVLRSGAPYTTLQWAADSAPQVHVRRDATLHASLSGEFVPNPDVDFLSDELRPVMVLGGVETPLGIYRATTVKGSSSGGVQRVSVEAYDRCWRVYSNKTESILHLAAGASYITEIRKLLTACGIALVIAAPTDAVLQTDREDWPVGTSYLTICNALLAEINYNSVWFDASGVCRLEPYREPSAERITRRYGVTEIFLPEQHPSPDWSDEEDLFDAANVFVVTCSNPDLDAPMTATAVNDNPASRKSTFRRGMRIVKAQSVNNIASQDELQAYADRLRNESLMSTRTITFYTLAEGGHGVGDVIALTHDEIGGVYLETGWRMTLAAGELMTHSAKRTVIA